MPGCDHADDLGLKPRSAAMMNGLRCARAKASATMGDESLRMTLPMDMKKLFSKTQGVLARQERDPEAENSVAYPNVDPDMSMYWPSVRMIPLGPAPPRKICTVPVHAGEDM